MTLYENFATHYDDIFPLNKDTLAFIVNYFNKGKTLDLGCGTGEYSLGLSRLGYETLGIDIDENMIRFSLEKAKRLSLLARFLKGNFKDIVYKNQYTNVFCIGNSFVHLTSVKEMKESLFHVFQSLKDHGTFIVQIINYDRILDQNITSLPTISNHGISFTRDYETDGDRIIFKTKLKIKNLEEESQTFLYPIRSGELIGLLKEIGFKEVITKDGFTEKPFSVKKSVQLVIVAKK